MKKTALLLIQLGLILLLPAFVQAQENMDSFDIKKPVSVGNSVMLLPKKSPLGALVRSVIFPGGGQFYNRSPLKGSLVFAVESGLLIAVAVEWKRSNLHLENFNQLPLGSQDKAWEFELYEYYRDMRNLHLWYTAGVVFFSMLDAYVDAHLYNFERDKVREVDVSLMPQVEKEKVGILLSINF